MPMRPPRIGGPATKAAWTPAAGAKPTKRIRGRAGQKLRAQVLAEEPLCRLCLKKGKTSKSTIVDHIKPLAWGGAETSANRQGLCAPCHDEKSAAERAISAEQRRRF